MSSNLGVSQEDVKEEDESLRLRIDYRDRSMIAVKDKYPWPRINDLDDQLRRAKNFYKNRYVWGIVD